MPKTKGLTIKQKKFVAEYVRTGNGTRSALAAYDTDDYNIAHGIASENIQKPAIQKAIDDALIKLQLTPEMAVEQLGKIALQDKELGAKRLASRDILELHGWRANTGQAVSFNVDTAFFNTKPQTKPVQEAKLVDPDPDVA